MLDTDKKLFSAFVKLATATGEEGRSAALTEIRTLVGTEVAPVYAPDTETVARKLLLEFGLPDALIGHRYIVKALILLSENPEMIDAITRKLYPAIAVAYGTTASRVERAIRHAVEVAVDRSTPEALEEYFANTVSCHKGKPTNGEFLARMAKVVRDRMKGAA